jgi:hypothetical protein
MPEQETVGPSLTEQGPFKAEVKWKEGATPEVKERTAELIGIWLDVIHGVPENIPELYNAIESITISPSGN